MSTPPLGSCLHIHVQPAARPRSPLAHRGAVGRPVGIAGLRVVLVGQRAARTVRAGAGPARAPRRGDLGAAGRAHPRSRAGVVGRGCAVRDAPECDARSLARLCREARRDAAATRESSASAMPSALPASSSTRTYAASTLTASRAIAFILRGRGRSTPRSCFSSPWAAPTCVRSVMTCTRKLSGARPCSGRATAAGLQSAQGSSWCRTMAWPRARACCSTCRSTAAMWPHALCRSGARRCSATHTSLFSPETSLRG